MADFPSKVSTETSSQANQNSAQGGNGLRGMAASGGSMVDMYFLKSIPAILMLVEVFLGLITWSLIAAGPHQVLAALGWVLFVCITTWILTIVLFVFILFGLHQKLPALPWPLVLLVYHGIAAVLYFTAFITSAVMVPKLNGWYYNHLAAASFFAALTNIAYGGSAFFSFLEWRADGGNAATSTVPT